MTALQSAVDLFADLVQTGQSNSVGAVEFDSTSSVLTPLALYTATQQSGLETAVGTLTPGQTTSIGGGLQLGQNQLPTGQAPRNVLIVFTDGMENTPPMIATVEPGVLATGSQIFAVGLGQPQNISSQALAELAASSGGKYFQTDDTLVLKKDFVEVLADAFANNLAADPIITLTPGQVSDTPVSITTCEQRLTFTLNWDNPLLTLALSIIAPDGTTYSSTSPGNNLLVRYGS